MAEYIDKAEALSRFSFYSGDRIPERDVDGFQNTITFHDAKAVIRSIRAADVRPVVRGRWEWMGPCRDSGGRLWATCTACGLRQRLGDFTMFCPHCGADMRGGDGDGE